MNRAFLSDIAARLPDDTDLGDERAVFTAAVKIDPRMQYADDETIQAIIEEARRLKQQRCFVEKVALVASMPVIAGIIWFATIVLAPEHAWAADHTHAVASWRGEAAFIVFVICGLIAVMWCGCAIAGGNKGIERDDDGAALARGDERVPVEGLEQ